MIDPAIDKARQLYLGVRTKAGEPHVTPELFARDGDRIWCLTAAKTLKARRLRSDGVFGAAAVAGSSCVLLKGTGQVVDGARLDELVGKPGLVAQAFEGTTRFVAGNVLELAGATRDFLKGRLGNPLDARRVALALDATWSAAVAAEEVQTTEALGPDLPGAVVVGLLDEDGAPVVVPARWAPEEATLTIETQTLELTGANATGPACVTRDRWTGLGPSGKQGYLLRGAAEVKERSTESTVLAFDLDREVSWDGVEVSSQSVKKNEA